MNEIAERVRDGESAKQVVNEQSINEVEDFETVMDGIQPAKNKIREAVREFESGRSDEGQATSKMLLGISELGRVVEELLFELDARDLSSEAGNLVQDIRNELG